jgi:hypothetical protein
MSHAESVSDQAVNLLYLLADVNFTKSMLQRTTASAIRDLLNNVGFDSKLTDQASPDDCFSDLEAFAASDLAKLHINQCFAVSLDDGAAVQMMSRFGTHVVAGAALAVSVHASASARVTASKSNLGADRAKTNALATEFFRGVVKDVAVLDPDV